jgi:O-antigen/teichoic acid export membrane protein
MAAGLATGLGNLIFNVLVAREGGAVNYGVLGPLLTLTTISGFLATGSQYAVARLVAIGAEGTRHLIRLAFRGVSPWLVLSALLLVLAVPVTAYMHLTSTVPVVLTALLAGATVLGAAPTGLLVGASRFRAVAAIMFGSVVLRLCLGILLGHGSGTVDGALLASLIPIVVAAGAALMVARRVFRQPPVAVATIASAAAVSAETAPGSGLLTTGIAGAMIAGSLWALWTLPVLSARHQLTPTQAGQFAAVQLLAGGILFACAPLVTAFYPTLARGRDRQAVVVGLLGTCGVGGLGAAGLGIVGPALMPRLYGSQFHPSAALLFCLGMSAAATAIGTYLCWVAVARRRPLLPVLFGLAAGLITDLTLCMLWAHTSIELGLSPLFALVLGGAVTAAASLAKGQQRVFWWRAQSVSPVHSVERNELEQCES